MQHLQIELVAGLDGHEAHLVALHGFADRLRSRKSFLFDLRKRLYELRLDEAHVRRDFQ
jgi:hypothetical protein